MHRGAQGKKSVMFCVGNFPFLRKYSAIILDEREKKRNHCDIAVTFKIDEVNIRNMP